MKFQITMNMASKNGNSVHQVIGEHPAANLEAFRKAISENDFITVEEYYSDGAGSYTRQGEIMLSTGLIGKVKLFKHSPRA